MIRETDAWCYQALIFRGALSGTEGGDPDVLLTGCAVSTPRLWFFCGLGLDGRAWVSGSWDAVCLGSPIWLLARAELCSRSRNLDMENGEILARSSAREM